MEEKLKKRNKIIIIIFFIVGLAGITFMSYDFILNKIRLTYETMNLKLNEGETPKIIDEDTNVPNENTTENTSEPKNYTPIKMDYIAYLEIPKISLTQGLVSMNSKYNNVNQNIQTIKTSTYPDKANGNLILAAHSGTSYISFFKNLYKLEKGDKAIITYNGKKYTFNIESIYTTPKTGSIPIYRDKTKTTLTLITCTKDDKDTQTIYIGYLI